MKIFSLAFLCLTISFSSCKKSDYVDSPSKNQILKNNQLWPTNRINASYSVYGNSITIFFYGGASEEYVAISLYKPTNIGKVPDFDASNIRLLGGDVFIDNFELDKTQTHLLEITSFNEDKKHISGNFSFNLKRDDWFTKALGATSNLFSGHFDMFYKN